MKEKLRNHIENLFSDATQNRKVVELKEELLSNSIIKYEDLIANGEEPEAAFKSVVSGIGDIDSLLKQFSSPVQIDQVRLEKSKTRSALLISLAVVLFILAPIGLIYVDLYVLFIFVAAGVGLLIFNSLTRYQPPVENETFVEEFRQWKSEKSSENKKIRSAISSILWPSVLILYFLLSFTTGRWDITWILFIVGACSEGIISLIFEIRKGG